MKRVLITDPIAQAGVDILQENSLEVLDLSGGSIEDILEVIGTVHGWIIRSGTTVDAELLNRADQLQVVGRAGVGIDNIDLEVATLRGVVVMNTPDGNTISAAEHTFALLLALARNVPQGHGQITTGGWDREALAGVELRGKTLGLVGLGRIGRRVMTYAKAFGMQVVGYDPYASGDLRSSGDVEMLELDDLLERSDFVSLHAPRTDETLNIINADRLKKMKSSARLINCARGGLVDEAALVAALSSGEIAGAALDVYAREPLAADDPLRTAPGLVLTPHLGASTVEAQAGVALAICQQVAGYLSSGELVGAVNMPVGDMEMVTRLDPFLRLSAIMGKMLMQLSEGQIKQIDVTCSETIESPELVALSAVKGVLAMILDRRLNFVNIGAVAKERGVRITHKVDSNAAGYANQVVVELTTDSAMRSMVGSVFGGQHARIVEIEGYHLELNPEGVMLFIRNHDAPGVLGRVGTALGAAGINIGEALLSREAHAAEAYLVIKVDTDPPQETLSRLQDLEGIISIAKVKL